MSDPRRYPRVSTCSSSGGGGPIEVTGTVDIGNTVDVTGTVGITGPIEVTGTVGVTGPIEVTGTVGINLATNGSGDAFNRLRVSNPFTLFEFNSILGKGDSSTKQVYIDETLTGTATSTHMPGDSYVKMAVATIGDTVVRQSHEYILYQPGKSKLIYMTGVLHMDTTATTGITSRMGTFDVSMGYFLEYSNGVVSIVERVQDGTENRHNRGTWLDNFDGLGPSGISSIDFTKAQILIFDFEWLGVGQVRCGLITEGAIHYFYKFTHKDALTAPYITTAKLPLRYEISSTATGATGEMRMICGTVISEGGFIPPGATFIYPTGPALGYSSAYPSGTIVPYWETDSPAIETFVPIVSIRPKSTSPARYGTIKIKLVDLFSTDATKWGCWRLVLNGTVTNPAGPITYVDHDAAGSIAEVRFHKHLSGEAATNDVYTANTGKILYENFFAGRSNSILYNGTEELLAAPSITVNLNGVQDTITLVCNNLSSSTLKIYAFIQWIELL